jgi:phage terminase large subunit-like protein
MASPDTDFDDDDSIAKGVQQAYGDAYWVDPEDIVQNRILSPRNPLSTSKRYYLNWPEAAEDAWTTQQQWSVLADPAYYIYDGDDIVMGFDGSRVNDATALIGCHVETGFTFSLGIWETDDGRVPIPVHEVSAAVRSAKERWHVCAFFADVNEWEEHTKVSWRALFEENLPVWAVPAGKDPQPVAWDMRSHAAEFTMACEMVEGEISSRAFVQDGDSALGRHVVNARRRPNRWGISIGKESPRSSRKIDACVAMIMARHARRLVLSNKNYKEEKKAIEAAGKRRIWSFS